MCTSGEEIARNVYGINLISRESGNQTVNYLYNGHGDVTSLIDQSGEILASYYYDVYGKITEQTGNFDNSITFSGYTLDSETGLYYLNARMYNPDDARFLQEDTYKGNPTDILSLNIYTYCVGNPLKYIDPTGHTATNSQADLNSGATRSGYTSASDETNHENFVVESFNEYFANRKLTVCAVFDWMTKLWGELVSQTPQEVLQDLRNSFALPDNLKSSFADTLAYLNDIKEEVAVVTTATVLIAGGVMLMPYSPSVGTGLVNAGFNVATKAVVEFAQNGKVTGSFSDYVKTGVAGFAAGTLSVAIANYGAAAGVTGVGKSLLASAGDMAADAATQYILKGKIDPKEVVVSGLTSFVCAEGFRQASKITSNLKSTKALKSYSSTQKVVNSVDDYADDVSDRYAKKVQTLERNRLQGQLFANEKFSEFQSISSNAQREITVRPKGYNKKIRLDAIGNLDNGGELVIYEYKSSKYAGFTENQKKGFIYLEKNGGVVVGKGKGDFHGGYIIDPIEVIILRPN